jgi:hypothetical protein
VLDKPINKAPNQVVDNTATSHPETFDLADPVSIERSPTNSELVTIVPVKAIQSSVTYSASAAFPQSQTAAARFQSFFSKIFGKKGKPFNNPALFFYLSGFFTVVIFILIALQCICIYRVIKRRQIIKSRKLVEGSERSDEPNRVATDHAIESCENKKSSRYNQVTPSPDRRGTNLPLVRNQNADFGCELVI